VSSLLLVTNVTVQPSCVHRQRITTRVSVKDYCPNASGAVFLGGEKVGTVEVPGYEITGVVGKGANGIVFSAVHRQLGREVVIKVYPLRPDRSGVHPYEQARSEAVKVEALKHDGLATLYEFGQLGEVDGIPGLSEGWPYCVMEHRAGKPLRDVLPDMMGDFSGRRSALRRIFDVLTYAEDRRALHGDLHTGNVLVDRYFGTINVSVIDFGTSLFAEEGQSERRHARLLRKTTFALLPELREIFIESPRLKRRTGLQMLPALVAALDLYEFIRCRTEATPVFSPRDLGMRLADAVDFDLDMLWENLLMVVDQANVPAVKQAFLEFLTHEHELEHVALSSEDLNARLADALTQRGVEETTVSRVA
jgi:serine/threonine protein kinase